MPMSFFIGQDKIHCPAGALPAWPPAFGRARADEDDLCLRLSRLTSPRRIDHRRVGHGNIAGLIREQSSCHHPPRRQHEVAMKRCSFGTFFEEIPCLFNCADVRARRDLDTSEKPERLHRPRRISPPSRLLPNCPANDGATIATTSFPSRIERMTLIDLTLVDDRAERAVDQTLAARDGRGHSRFSPLAVLVQTDRVHPARCLTRALKIGDRVIGQDLAHLPHLMQSFWSMRLLPLYKFHRALSGTPRWHDAARHP